MEEMGGKKKKVLFFFLKRKMRDVRGPEIALKEDSVRSSHPRLLP